MENYSGKWAGLRLFRPLQPIAAGGPHLHDQCESKSEAMYETAYPISVARSVTAELR